jgi:hypothetical protein
LTAIRRRSQPDQQRRDDIRRDGGQQRRDCRDVPRLSDLPDETKATMARLQSFSLDTDPLVKQLKPVAHDLSPTLRSVRVLAPSLRSFLNHLGPLITVSQTGLPAIRDVLNGATPLLASGGPVPGAAESDPELAVRSSAADR